VLECWSAGVLECWRLEAGGVAMKDREVPCWLLVAPGPWLLNSEFCFTLSQFSREPMPRSRRPRDRFAAGSNPGGDRSKRVVER
jgi:hypothetical protein